MFAFELFCWCVGGLILIANVDVWVDLHNVDCFGQLWLD